MKKIKTVTGYAPLARFLASLIQAEDGTAEVWGYVVNRQEVATPYSYSPTHTVYSMTNGTLVVILETAHRRYEVFDVTRDQVYGTMDAAEAAFLAPRA